MKFSIVTPSFNQGEFIERTIESVLSQQIPDLEYWIMDGKSSDETLQILNKYRGRVQWISAKDAGQADAVNQGILRATGEIVGWLNSDDVYYPGALHSVLDFFALHPEVQVLYGDADHIDENDQYIGPYPTKEWDYSRLQETCYICQPAVFFRRDFLQTQGLLDTTLNYCMDYEYWLRIGKTIAMHHLPQKLAGSRLHPATKTLGDRRKVHEEILDMVCAKTGKFSVRWAANLGYAIALDKSLKWGSMEQDWRILKTIFLTIWEEKRRRRQKIDIRELQYVRSWLKSIWRKF